MGNPRTALQRLYVITDRGCAEQGLGSVEAVVEAALEGGARFFQFRDKRETVDRSLWLGRRLVDRWHESGATYLINGRADLAVELEADGVHRPGHGLPVAALRRLLGEMSIVGVSTHDLDEARAAEEAGADFITLSPVYTPGSKPDYGPPLGLEAFADITLQIDCPVFALGGITPDRVEECLEAGAWGVAVMSGIMAADDPASAARTYLEALQAASTRR